MIECVFCNKLITSKYNLKSHQKTKKCKKIQEDKKQNIHLEKIKELQKELSQQKDYYEEKLEELQNTIKEIATEAVKGNVKRVKYLEDKYLKKQQRRQFDEQNVIYILTTDRLQKDRIFIFGKATDLTNRLSTYNKTDEHNVIYYKSCETKENMDIIEKMIFLKLKEYKERENRERYILPINKDISFFINEINDCLKFLNIKT